MSRRLVVWLVVLAAWTLLAAVFAVSSSLTYVITYRPPQWGRTFGLALTEWYPWAALTPVVVLLANRLTLARRRKLLRALALAAAGLPIAMAKVMLTTGLRAIAGSAEYYQISNLATQYLIYWAIVAIAHAAAYYRGERERELRASQAETRLAEARLQLLRMQIHPHFLFNTLNTIAELVHENPSAAERMIGSLSQLLRETLDAGTIDRVTLGRELELLERYVEIQRSRFGDRLDVRTQIDPDTRDALVPIFILQPLVENAIRHGLSARIHAGRIDIIARREGHRVAIEVRDDGIGLTAGERREGVGLGNSRARLVELYGPAQDFEVANAEGAGTVVRLSIPWQTDKEGIRA
jgi:two-component system, LytTR family, sensor kinase